MITWMHKIASRLIIDQVLLHLQKLPGQWHELQRADTGMGQNVAGQSVHEWNLNYEVYGIKLPYDKFFVVVWLQIRGSAPPGTRRFNLEYGHKDVAFEVAVFAPRNRRDPDSDIVPIGFSQSEFHTPAEVAEFVFKTISNDRSDDNEDKETNPGPVPTPEFAPVGR